MTMIRFCSFARSKSSVVIGYLPALALGVSVAANLLMARTLVARGQPAVQEVVGTEAASFEADTASGAKWRVSFTETRPTILYHFSPTCQWCERNWENVRALVAQTRGAYRFIAVSTTPVSERFLQQRHLDIEVAANVSPALVKQYGLGGTPQMLLVSTDRRVVNSWKGAWTRGPGREIESAFSLRLPGLSQLNSEPTRHP